MSPATPTVPSSASTSCFRPTARPVASACSSCAPFEMPPHARMSLTQQLLLRAMIARFWEEPLCRAGPAGALGHRAARPLHAAALRRAGFSRRHGRDAGGRLSRSRRNGSRRISNSASRNTASICGQGHRVRTAPRARTLACDGRGGRPAVARCATSIRRSSGLQVKVKGMAPDRYVLTCNGVALPLQNTGTNGEFVAGVRYRAWQPDLLPASDHRRACAAGLRSGRYLDAAFAGWLSVSRRPIPAGATSTLPGQCLRGRKPAPGALLPFRSTRLAGCRSQRRRSAPSIRLR